MDLGNKYPKPVGLVLPLSLHDPAVIAVWLLRLVSLVEQDRVRVQQEQGQELGLEPEL